MLPLAAFLVKSLQKLRTTRRALLRSFCAMRLWTLRFSSRPHQLRREFSSKSHGISAKYCSVFFFRFWMMPALMLKKMVMGGFDKGLVDAAIADSIDFMVDSVGFHLHS